MYEGGLKLWEAAEDLVAYLGRPEVPSCKGKRVAEASRGPLSPLTSSRSSRGGKGAGSRVRTRLWGHAVHHTTPGTFLLKRADGRV